MEEFALERADPELVRLVDRMEQSDRIIAVTRNGHEVARIMRARERPPSRAMSGAEVEAGFRSLQERVRDHWPDEPEFDWKEAIQSGRR